MDDPTKDTIPRSAVEYCLRKETVNTNPDAYESHERFIAYMDDPDISQFGHWMHSNGFNCALVSIAVDLDKIPSVTPPPQPGQRNARVFQGIIVEYPSISAYPEYEGKPYFSIKYTENGQGFIGYGTYKPEVLSEYLKEYFTPSAQPWCEDAVSRTAAIDALPYLLDYEGFKGESGYVSKNLVRTMLKGLPSVTPKQPGWIPCTPETMPQEDGEYLVTIKWDEGDYDVDIYEYDVYFKEWNDGELYGEVVAWQPKPKPWEGEKP